MKHHRSHIKSLTSITGMVCFILILFTQISFAQLIGIKTVPVATGSQPLLFPSRNISMGGVLIAIDDPLLDPHVNPAKGSRLNGTLIYTSPAHYNISEGLGSGLIMPLGVLHRKNDWFGGLAYAFQQIQPASIGRAWEKLSDKNLINYYLFGMAGKSILNDQYSIGVSLFYKCLSRMDGVDLLYANSNRIEQFGHIFDLRIGFLSNAYPNKTFEILLLHNRVNMTHKVTYLDWWGVESLERVEKNLDQTWTWGLHIGYVERKVLNDWNIGGIFTFNYKSHPKIPNYELMNIPRDPGNTYAFNIGFGVSNTPDDARFAIEFVYEPIWSNTWADTDEPIRTVSGKLIPAGGKTVENDFQFSNYQFKIGWGHDYKSFGTSFGLNFRSYKYTLNQTNFIQEFKRTQNENWMELTLSFGLSFFYSEFRARYNMALNFGTGLPGVETAQLFWGSRTFGNIEIAPYFIVAPSGPLTIQSALVTSHQLIISIPLMR